MTCLSALCVGARSRAPPDAPAALGLPQWLNLSTARSMLLQRLMGHVAVASLDAEEADKLRRQVLADSSTNNTNSRSSTRDTSRSNGNGKSSSSNATSSGASSSSGGGVSQGGSPTSSGESGHHNPRDCLLDLDLWTDTGFPTAVAVAVMACVKGVKRAHLVDARLDGGMLLELYSRDGVGTMISTDFYEGIRRATSRDLEAVQVSQAWLVLRGWYVAALGATFQCTGDNGERGQKASQGS